MVQEVNFRESDGNIGSPPPNASRTVLIMAPCSSGTPNTVYSIGTADGVSVVGNGPGPEAARHILEIAGRPVLVMPLTTTAGVIGAVTPPGAGTPPTLTPSGTPYDNYKVKVEIRLGGALATAKFRYSLDDGQTWSGDLFTAASYPIPDSGLTLGFAAGTYVLADLYTFTASAPSFSAANLNTAFDAAQIADYAFGIVYIVGEAGGVDDAAKSAASAAIVAAATAKQLAMYNAKRPIRIILELPYVADAAALSAFASFAGTGSRSPVVVAAWGRVQSAMPHGRAPLVNLARLVVPLIVSKPLGKDASAFNDDGYSGKMPSALVPGTNVRDERKTPGLDAAKFTTVKTFIDVGGVYLENVRLMSQFGSDFKYIQHGQVIDRALVVARAGLLPYLSRNLDVKTAVTEPPTAGQMTESQCLSIELDISTQLSDDLVQPGHIQGLRFLTDRTKNLITTEEIGGRIYIAAKGYPKSVDLVAGLAKTLPAQPAP